MACDECDWESELKSDEDGEAERPLQGDRELERDGAFPEN